MSVLGERYLVKEGDSLWKISEKKFGDPFKWRSIYNHNNRNEVIAATKTKIKDPDLIFVGQSIYIPNNLGRNEKNRNSKHESKYTPINTGKKTAYNKVKGIPFKFNLENLPVTKVEAATFIAIIKVSGGVTIQTKETFDFVTISQEGFEATAKNEAASARDKLVAESKVGFNNTTKEITFECAMSVQANYRNAPVFGTAVGVSSYTGLPALKASIKFPPLKGEISNHFFASQDFSVEIEISPKGLGPQLRQAPINEPAPQRLPNKGPSGWDFIDKIAIAFGAGVLVGAALGDDIVLFPVGFADDIPAFATAAGMLTIAFGMSKDDSEKK